MAYLVEARVDTPLGDGTIKSEWVPAFFHAEDGLAATKLGARKLLSLAIEQGEHEVYRVVNENTGEPVVLPVGTEWWNRWLT